MKDPQILHQSAMALLQEALVARHLGDEGGAMAHLRASLEAETSAAMALETDFGNEPTRSILFRSAASLAMDCREYETAKSLVDRAMLGNVPPEFQEELLLIWKKAVMEQDAQSQHGNTTASPLEERIVLTEPEMEQLFQIMGRLSEAEISTLRKERSLVERLMNAAPIFLLQWHNRKSLQGG